MKLKNILSEMNGMPVMKVLSNPLAKAFSVVNEAEDDRYTHIGYGKYKEKGKEDDKSAPTFTKTDSGKYVPTSGGEDKPQDTKGGVNIFDKDYDGGNEEPKAEPQVKPRPADKLLTKTVDKFSKKLGLSPEKLGKEEYEKRMLSYVHDALEDANFHSANRQIFADLQGRPELAKRPDYSKAPEFGTPEREEWEEKNSIYNKAFDASVTDFDDSDEAVGELTSQAGWEGEKIIDALLDKLRKDGSGELADKIQISFDKDMTKSESTKLKDLV